MRLFRIFSLALMLSCAGAQAGNHHAIVVSQALARATIGSQANGAAFLTIENRGKTDDALISASSPAASIVEIHTMRMEGDVMKMRALEQLPVPAGRTVEMKPGQGAHLMLIDLGKPLVAGDKFPVTLEFRKAGKLPVTVEVTRTGRPNGNGGTGHDAHSGNH